MAVFLGGAAWRKARQSDLRLSKCQGPSSLQCLHIIGTCVCVCSERIRIQKQILKKVSPKVSLAG